MTRSKTGLFIPTGLSPEGILLICEGPTDTAAALDLGFPAIGRPNCNSKVEMTAEIVKGKDVVIIGDNDDGGRAGAERLSDTLVLYCKDVRIVYPPEGIKDLRDWLKAGLTEECLKNIINETEILKMNITVDYKSNGSNIRTKVILTVRQEEKLLLVDEVNLAKQYKRG